MRGLDLNHRVDMDAQFSYERNLFLEFIAFSPQNMNF